MPDSHGVSPVLTMLADKGPMTSAEIQRATGKSQPTVSRMLSGLKDEIVVLGKGTKAHYALPMPIGGAPAQQPVWLIDDVGDAQKVGTLSYLANDQLAMEWPGGLAFLRNALPWYLAPLKAQGFLGRLLARHMGLPDASANPDLWDLQTVLHAALQLHDAPGALRLGFGDSVGRKPIEMIPAQQAGEISQATSLDRLSADVAKTLPAGSSAGGEQPKFLAMTDSNEHVLVKFSPPRGTPFGDRWTDLLYAESVCAEVLARHGQVAAKTQVVRGSERTYLVSYRFDRIGMAGRKHVVPVGAAHAAFVPGPYANWASTCDALARQRKLSAVDAEAATFLLHFGRLVGNSDMHSGNLSLFVQGGSLTDISKGNFDLAPIYDMLPMRWKPDAATGLPEYAPFGVEDTIAMRSARAAALDFWGTLSDHPWISAPLRTIAVEMTLRTSVGF
jgi:hypothetical protein